MKKHHIVKDEEYMDETEVYRDDTTRRAVVWELLVYAHMLYKRVYVFKNFEAYARSLDTPGGNPADEYWEGASYEKRIDEIKICTAFENYNKAVLLANGYVVHNIDQRKNRSLAEQQKKSPVAINEFLNSNSFVTDEHTGELYLEGFRNFTTLSFSKTLTPAYQRIIGLDAEFINYLSIVNEQRNRLHFNKNYSGAVNFRRHLAMLKYAKDYGTSRLENEIETITNIQKELNE